MNHLWRTRSYASGARQDHMRLLELLKCTASLNVLSLRLKGRGDSLLLPILRARRLCRLRKTRCRILCVRELQVHLIDAERVAARAGARMGRQQQPACAAHRSVSVRTQFHTFAALLATPRRFTHACDVACMQTRFEVVAADLRLYLTLRVIL